MCSLNSMISLKRMLKSGLNLNDISTLTVYFVDGITDKTLYYNRIGIPFPSTLKRKEQMDWLGKTALAMISNVWIFNDSIVFNWCRRWFQWLSTFCYGSINRYITPLLTYWYRISFTPHRLGRAVTSLMIIYSQISGSTFGTCSGFLGSPTMTTLPPFRSSENCELTIDSAPLISQMRPIPSPPVSSITIWD